MVIRLHLVAAILALGLGAANLALAKGTLSHRIVGWVWIATMLCVTLSSFGIRELNQGAFSWIHLLTVWTLVSMFLAIYLVRRGRIRGHAGFMIGTMTGAVAAGLFALAPGRFIATVVGY